MQRIVVGGMGQSGSTLLHNIIKHIILFDGRKCSSTSSVSSAVSCHFKNKTDVLITKVHKRDLKLIEWADIIFTSKRDPRDGAASGCKRHGDKKHLYMRIYNNNIGYYEDFKQYSTYEFVYETYKGNPHKIIAEIAGKLNVAVNKEVIEKIYTDVENIPNNKNLPNTDDWNNPLYVETLLSKSHITSNGKIGYFNKYFSEEQIKTMESTHKNWLVNNGYKLHIIT